MNSRKKNDISFILTVKVVPNASRSSIKVEDTSECKIYLNSTPQDGRANQECIKLLSKTFKIPKGALFSSKKVKTRSKRLRLVGIDEALLRKN